MKLQKLLIDIDLSRTKLVRHNISNDTIAHNYPLGYIEIYQRIQPENKFKNTDYVLSFLGDEGTKGKYLGCYKLNGFEPYKTELLPIDFYLGSETFSNCVMWNMERTDILSDWIDRLVIDWGKGTINWCQNGTTEKEILYISPSVSEIEFTSYDQILIPYQTLRTIVYNRKQFHEWENKLSAIAGIYLITDTKTGKHYVGSASGEDGGIWQRWSDYAHTKHGGNSQLVKLIATDPDYSNNFLYSILEVFPIKRDKHEVLEYEQLYKRKLQSLIPFGLNEN